jgi:hypothetical protein
MALAHNRLVLLSQHLLQLLLFKHLLLAEVEAVVLA